MRWKVNFYSAEAPLYVMADGVDMDGMGHAYEFYNVDSPPSTCERGAHNQEPGYTVAYLNAQDIKSVIAVDEAGKPLTVKQ